MFHKASLRNHQLQARREDLELVTMVGLDVVLRLVSYTPNKNSRNISEISIRFSYGAPICEVSINFYYYYFLSNSFKLLFKS